MSTSATAIPALDRARRKAYIRLLPILFLSYAIAYVDRVNVSLATIEMSKDFPAFNNAVVGFGAGVFFIGYFILEIPGTLLVEKWSARKWICRIMISWGIVAALTAFVKTPFQFYGVRPCAGPLLVLYRHASCANLQSEGFILFAADRHHRDIRQCNGAPSSAVGIAGLAVDVHRVGHTSSCPGDISPFLPP
jgi:MFS family permease